ncbi:MAG: NAD(P)/FAD-dependent oxidoreductase [Halarsenatibacteraceae bacterium]
MNRYDAVIIGGGVIGTNISYYLSKSGLKVALVEKGDIAAGTSSGCDGNVLIADKQPGFDTDLAYASQHLFKELNKKLDHDFDYTQKGSIYVIESEEEREVAKEFVDQQVENGYSMRMMDYDTVHSDEPLLADDIIGGVEIDFDASVYPMDFAYALTDAASKNGLDIYDHTEVTNIDLKSGRIESVKLSNGEKIYTDRVINAAGVWAPEIGRMVDLNIPIKPRQGQILVAEKTIQVGRRKIIEFGYMMAKFGNKNYKRNVHPKLDELGIAFVYEPTGANNFLIGSSRRFVGFDTSLSFDIMKGLAARAIRFFPAIENVNVIRGYAGLRPYVPDHFPIVSEVEKVPGFYIAAGHEGDGIGLGPVTGRLIDYIITGEEFETDLDLDLAVNKLSFNRFKN